MLKSSTHLTPQLSDKVGNIYINIVSEMGKNINQIHLAKPIKRLKIKSHPQDPIELPWQI